MEKFLVNSEFDGLPLRVNLVEPTGEKKAIVLFLHGMAEHIDRYDELAEHLNACGYVVVGNDHAGHGKSISSRCPAGFFEEKSG